MSKAVDQPGAELTRSAPVTGRVRAAGWAERQATTSFVLPAVLLLFFLSIFPLLVSAYLSLTRFLFVPGGFALRWVGLANYQKLLVGLERSHFLGVQRPPAPLGWLVFGLSAVALLVFVVRGTPASSGRRPVIGRAVVATVVGAAVWLAVRSLAPRGFPGTLLTTLIYVFVGIAAQYWLGLMLAYLCSLELAGRRFFRVVFLLPMMITPVGIAYTFRILMDLGKGPFAPLWRGLGLAEVSWANYAWGARAVVMIGDVWQWTPFMFVVLLAALESLPAELLEAAMVDGASRWQIFWRISWPQLVPVTSTLILIRMIEAFKIIDMPNVLTNGGPGTATESLTLHAFMAWRTLDIGGSAAVAYMLLFVVTFAALSYINLLHHRLAETA